MAKQTFTAGQVLTATQVNGLQTNDFNQTVSTKTAAYTFVVGDRGTRVVLNDTTARTFTIDDSIFSAGDTIFVHNINTGVLTIAAGAGVTLNGADVLTVAQYQGGTIFFTSASSAIFFPTAKTVSAGGLVVVKAETSFSASSSVTADSVFTSTFTNYMMTITATTSQTATVRLRYRTSGSSNSTSNYNFTDLRVQSNGVAGGLSTSQANINLHEGGQTNPFSTSLMIYSPQTATRTQVTTASWNNNAGTATYQTQFVAGNFEADTQFDGIEIFPSAGNMTGSYIIYGLAKS